MPLNQDGQFAGFFHEQSRADRNDHVTVHYDNIRPDQKDNFMKYSLSKIDHLDTEYDLCSIMHYEETAFSKVKLVCLFCQHYWTLRPNSVFSSFIGHCFRMESLPLHLIENLNVGRLDERQIFLMLTSKR